VTPDEAYDVVRGFVELYHDHGDRQVRAKNRSRFFVDDHGTEWIRDLLDEEYVDADLRTAGEDIRDEYTYNAGRTTEDGKQDYTGVHEQSDGRRYVGLSVPVGRLPAEEAIELADLADEYGSGEVRLTRRQNPIIVDVNSDRVDELLAAEPLLAKHRPEPNRFVRGAMACTGTEFCSIALVETKTRMATMLRWLRENVDLPDDVDQLKIHFSGCTADCGQANTADIGLLGMRARKDGEMVEAVDIGVGGGMGEEPSFVDYVQQRVPADEAPGAIRNLIEAFAERRARARRSASGRTRPTPRRSRRCASPRRRTTSTRRSPTRSSRGTRSPRRGRRRRIRRWPPRMTDRMSGPAADDAATAAEEPATVTEDPTDDRAQHASADVAPELFGW